MRPNDYKSLKQAQEYYSNRFDKGLKLVSKDELDLVGQWIFQITNNKSAVYLDIGTGTGRVLEELLNHSPKKIFALDQSDSMLSQLKLHYKKAVEDKIIKILPAISEKIPLPDCSVDISTSLHLFKHLPNIEPTLQEVNRVLKKNGHFIFDVLNKNSIIRFNLRSYSCYCLSKSELISKLDKNGFKVLEIIQLHIFGETIYKLPGSNLIHNIDKFFTKKSLGFGIKFFILAKKI